MGGVNLDEAWPSIQKESAPVTSARRTVDEPTAPPPPLDPERLDELLASLRNELDRRSATTTIVAMLAITLGLLYIDSLHRQLRELRGAIRRPL